MSTKKRVNNNNNNTGENKKHVTEKASLKPWDYPNWGLDHSIDHLVKVYPTLHTLSVQEQAEYADATTRTLCANKECERLAFCIHGWKIMPWEGWIAPTVGDLAYIHLHGPTEKLREDALLALKTWTQRRRYEDGTHSPLWMLGPVLIICLGMLSRHIDDSSIFYQIVVVATWLWVFIYFWYILLYITLYIRSSLM